MNLVQTRLCLALHRVAGIDAALMTRLLLRCGSPVALREAGPPRWRTLGLAPDLAASLARTLEGNGGAFDPEPGLAQLEKIGADIVPITDERYPPLLRAIHDPPPLLYVRGDPALLSQPQLAVVGSRRASSAGLRAAAAFAAEATRAGLHVTSGLALGIDGAAHQGALAASGRSVAVLATGIDQVYPRRHRGLAGELARDGCLASELPLGVPLRRHHFPRRNRLISGLSQGVLVIEAALPSGSLITARTALDQGREVFALPWSVYHRGGAGCLHLIREGAKMVETIGDVLEELGAMHALQRELMPSSGEPPRPPSAMSRDGAQLLELVGYEWVTADELSQLSALPSARVMTELSLLELQGVVTRGAGGYMRS